MNKTFTINLAGQVFHIDDNAYDALRVYLDRLRARFGGGAGNEIVNDIETRIAEMFQQKTSSSKNVITFDDVNEVIRTMGQPEDIAGETSSPNDAIAGAPPYKRIYRNPEDKVLGGVCSGIGAYFGFDPVWLRLAFVVAVLFIGTGVLLYAILWIVIPEAKTPAEKLEMRGEAVNVSNLERNIRNEALQVRDNIKRFGSEITGERNREVLRRGASRIGDGLAEVFRFIGRFLAVFFGVLVSAWSVVILIALSVAVFVVIGWFPADNFPSEHLDYFVSPDSMWLLIVGVVLLVGIPALVLLLNGIKLIFRLNLSLRKTGVVMVAFWLVGIALCVWQGMTVAKDYHSKTTVSQTEHLHPTAHTLVLKANHIVSPETRRHGNIRVNVNDRPMLFTQSGDTVWCTAVRLDVDLSRDDSVYLVTSYNARGSNATDARNRARAIEYNHVFHDSVLYVDNAFNLNNDRYRMQGVDVTLKIPAGYNVVFDRSLRDVVYDVDNTTNVLDDDMLGHTWKMTVDGLECSDCTGNERRREIIPELDRKPRNRTRL